AGPEAAARRDRRPVPINQPDVRPASADESDDPPVGAHSHAGAASGGDGSSAPERADGRPAEHSTSSETLRGCANGHQHDGGSAPAYADGRAGSGPLDAQ